MSTLILATNKPVVPTVTQSVSKPKPKPEKPPTAKELLRLVNIEREKVGVKPLKIDANVQKSAQLKADDMYKRNYFSHKVKGTDKVLTPEMNDLLVASCTDSSENIVDNIVSNDSKTAVEAWVDSKPHYKAMVNKSYTLTGFGISGTKIVQHFCIAR